MFLGSNEIVKVRIRDDGSYLYKRVYLHFDLNIFRFFRSSICRFWVSGSSINEVIRGKEDSINDYDLFFPDWVNRDIAKAVFLKEGFTVKYDNENVERLEKTFARHSDEHPTAKLIKIDLVKNYFWSPDECLKDFDFSVSSLAICPDYFYCNLSSLIDLSAMRLRLNPNIDPKDVSFQRVSKYVNKGFKNFGKVNDVPITNDSGGSY